MLQCIVCCNSAFHLLVASYLISLNDSKHVSVQCLRPALKYQSKILHPLSTLRCLPFCFSYSYLSYPNSCAAFLIKLFSSISYSIISYHIISYYSVIYLVQYDISQHIMSCHLILYLCVYLVGVGCYNVRSSGRWKQSQQCFL